MIGVISGLACFLKSSKVAALQHFRQSSHDSRAGLGAKWSPSQSPSLTSVRLFFSESLDEIEGAVAARYEIDNGIGIADTDQDKIFDKLDED